jgi:16S rRNA processing protein RimM
MSGRQAGESESDRLLVMGQVAAPYGIRGWVHVTPYTERQDGLLEYPVWHLRQRGDWQPVRLLQGRLHGKGLVVQLEGCADRDAAAGLAGAEIGIWRSELPAIGRGEYYWSDLVGLDVITTSGKQLGKLDHLIDTGANDVMVVRGEREHLIPYITGQVIRSVDLDAGEIRVDWDPDF